MAIRTNLFRFVSLGLAICGARVLACSSDSAKPTPGGADGGAGGGPGSSYSCELCACQPKSSARPANMFKIVETLLEALQGAGDPGSTYIGVMPNHESPFWTVPAIGFSSAKAEIG